MTGEHDLDPNRAITIVLDTPGIGYFADDLQTHSISAWMLSIETGARVPDFQTDPVAGLLQMNENWALAAMADAVAH